MPVIINGASKGSLDSVKGPLMNTTFFSLNVESCLPLRVSVPTTVKVAEPPNKLPNLVQVAGVLKLIGGS